MAKRGQTDEVFETLQAVQRRMSGLTEHENSPPENTEQPYWRTNTSPIKEEPVIAGNQENVKTDVIKKPITIINNAKRPLQINGFSLQFMITLNIFWICMVAVAYYTGTSFSDNTDSIDISTPETSKNHQLPEYEKTNSTSLISKNNEILLIESIRSYNSTSYKNLSKKCKAWNKWAKGQSYQELFALRETQNKGLQIIYGKIGNRYGVDQKKHKKMYKYLKSKYKTIRWHALK